ncbi:hypothetical protein B0920_20235 [Massilia sp. KIM]|uniref:hypothetical protein n=1 Tax=Massilia sp. KIM TaxID=1955422 RepID=UPI00098FF2F6|nr:hypothetical protein [Massilia sp. KIM]OON61241.1 hypothetical protein B0920_20235 [Massilia sp. KIM]
MWHVILYLIMKKQVVHISAMQSAKVMAAIYLVLSIPFGLLMAVPMLMGEQPMSILVLVLMPILYCVIGFVFTLVGAWIYNLVAARIGGFEFTTAEVGERS